MTRHPRPDGTLRRKTAMRRLRDALAERAAAPESMRTTKALARACALSIDEARRALITMDTNGEVMGILVPVDGRTQRVYRWRGQ